MTWRRPSGWIGGKENICEAVGRSWSTVKYWIDEEGFPALKMAGRWQTHQRLMDDWLMEHIRNRNGHKNAVKG